MRHLSAALALMACLLAPASAQADFGFQPGAEGFEAIARAEGGAPDTLAGSHPYALTLRLGFEGGDARNLTVAMPPGLLQNPAALDRCTQAQFNTPRSSPFEASRSGEDCPYSSQLGTIDVHTGLGGGSVRRFGVFNLVPAPGVPAQIGFAPYGVPVVLDTGIVAGPEGTYTFTLEAANLTQAFEIQRLDLTLWGTPWGASHDGERGDCLNEAEPEFAWAKCSVGPPVTNRPLAYLTMPTDCGEAMRFTATATAWQQPTPAAAAYESTEGGQPVHPEGCAGLGFGPTSFGQLTDRKASSASGFSFSLANKLESLTFPDERLPSQPRTAVVSLPDGVTVNPSLGVGLGVCTPGQLAAETAFSPPGAGCPSESKIGDFTVRTPLFKGEEELEGAIYIAQPDDPSAPGAENPFDSLLAVYLVAKTPQRGLLVKLAGKLVPDPADGQIVASFDDLPKLPYTELALHFRVGQRAPLITPASCGPALTRIELTPWATGLAPLSSTTASQIETGIGGGPCPSGTPPFAPQAIAGSLNSNSGSYTPFYLHLTRADTEQEITSYSAVLPRGITGRLAGIPFCPDAAIAAARIRSGREETANPSCPAASRIGRTLAGYGVGSALAYAPGGVYLAGPYHGQPLSIVTIDAATVGPFDLGTVVIRSAFEVDPETAQLRIDSAGSDPIPHILGGIPLHLREVRVFIDRPNFTRNATGCEPSQVLSTLTGSGARFGDPSDDSSATVSNHYQLLNCRDLGFRPRLGLRLRGPARRGAFPSLRATYATRGPRDSNLRRIEVDMPHQLFLAQNHIRAVCSRPQFESESCPPGSVYGSAAAFTPLLDQPLRGEVYLRSSENKLPDLVADLRSGSIRIVLEGRIGPSGRGGIQAFFDELPDAPIERFTMLLRGGRQGLLVNSVNVCAHPPSVSVKALGQNNVGATFTTPLRGRCARHAHGARAGHRHREAAS
jgi:hypothetical protein